MTRPVVICLLSCLLCLLFAINSWAKPVVKPKKDAPQIEELFLSVQINSFSKAETLLFLKQVDGRLLMLAEDWQHWRLKPAPASAVFRYEEQDYYYLDELQGVTYRVNLTELSVAIQVDISWFQSSHLQVSQGEQIVTAQSASGAFLSYEIVSSYTQKSQTDTNLFLDGVLFYPIGVFEHQWLVPHLESQQRKITRLNTTFVKDDLNQITTLKVGDSITSNLGLGGGVRFAGLQWLSNFNLRPTMIKYNLPSLSAEALLPSTVDIFMNKAKSYSQQVPAGAFTLEDIPIVSGRGEARVVVKDLLGREQVFLLPYYADADVLKAGLQEYAVESGVVREDYGIESSNYGTWFGVGSYRKGLTSNITGEFQAQIQEKQQTLRYGALLLSPKIGLVKTWFAQSWQKKDGIAYAFGAGFNPQYKLFDFSVDWQYQDPKFTQLGVKNTEQSFNESVRLFTGLSLRKYGALRAQYNYSKNYEQPAAKYIQGGYSYSLGKYGSILASLGQTLQPKQKTTAQISLSMPLFNKQSLSISASKDNQQRVNLQKSLPAGDGFGYVVSAETGQMSQTQGAVSWQNAHGRYQVRLSEQNNEYNADINVSGAVAWLGGQGFWSRQINNSFAVAKVASYANVSIYNNNQLIGKTNKQGVALIPRLEPYQKNTLRINPSDLPFDAEMTVQEQEVIPAYRSGIWINFPVRRSYAATMTILLDNGQPLPAGAEVYKQDSTEAFPVGFRGELYITGLSAKNSLTAEWKGQKCTFEVEFAMVDDSLPDLGSYLCKGVAP